MVAMVKVMVVIVIMVVIVVMVVRLVMVVMVLDDGHISSCSVVHVELQEGSPTYDKQPTIEKTGLSHHTAVRALV